MRVGLAQGCSFINSLNNSLRYRGWILCLYGSVLRGEGRDLDVVAFNIVPNPDVSALFGILSHHGWHKMGPAYNGFMGDGYSVMWSGSSYNDPLTMDLQIRIQEMKDLKQFVTK